MGYHKGDGTSNPKFVRPFNDWEMDAVLNFICMINNKKKINRLEKDRLLWKGDKIGLFLVKANFVLLEGGNLRTVSMKMIWNNCVPPKVSFFAWEVWWGKVLTMEQLKKRGFHMASRCHLCGKVEEDLDHLLVHHPSVWGLWAALISISSLQWVCPYLVKDLLSGWAGFLVRKMLESCG